MDLDRPKEAGGIVKDIKRGIRTEKFKTTLKPRQKITGVTKGQEIQESVEKGFLIFPGAHGSSDNLDGRNIHQKRSLHPLVYDC